MNNKERLESNLDTTKENISNYLANIIGDENEIDGNSRLDASLLSFLSGNMLAPELSIVLERERDLELGITWHEYDNHQDGTVDLIRDASRQQDILQVRGRTIEQAEARALEYSRAIGSLNLYQASIKTLELEGKLTDKAKKQLKSKILGDLNKLKNLDAVLSQTDKDRKEQGDRRIDFNQSVADYVDVIESAGVTGAREMLEVARDYVNMDNRQFHITTISASDLGYMIESETALLGLTDEQRDYYTDRQNREWYKNKDEFTKKLIDAYSDKIIKGDTILPIQGLDSLPGIRNAYIKSTYVADKEKKDLQKVSQTAHSGTITYHGKVEEKEQTRHVVDNINQLRSFLPKDRELAFNSLNHRVMPETWQKIGKYTGALGGYFSNAVSWVSDKVLGEKNTESIKKLTKHDESTILDPLKRAVKDLEGVERFITPANPYVAGINSKSYKFFKDSRQGFLETIKNKKILFDFEMASAIEERLEQNLDKFIGFKLETYDTIIKHEILPFVKDPKLREVLDALIDAQNAYSDLQRQGTGIQSSMVQKIVGGELNGPARSGVNLAAAMKRFHFLCEEYQSQLKRLEIHFTPSLIDTFCKSGKDRTGLTEYTTSLQSVCSYLRNKEIAEFYEACAKALKHHTDNDSKNKIANDFASKMKEIYDEWEKREKQILESQVKGKHTQIIPSINAGTPGSHGVIDAMQRLYYEHEYQGKIIEKSAKQNHCTPSKSKVQGSNHWYADHEIDVILDRRIQETGLVEVHRMDAMAIYTGEEAQIGNALNTERLRIRLAEIMSNENELQINLLNDQPKQRTILVPIQINGNHWIGANVRMGMNEQPVVTLYDSLGNLRDNAEVLGDIKEVFARAFGNNNFLLEVSNSALRQNDFSSCGAFTIENLILSAYGPNQNIDQDKGKSAFDIRKEHQVIYDKDKEPKIKIEEESKKKDWSTSLRRSSSSSSLGRN